MKVTEAGKARLWVRNNWKRFDITDRQGLIAETVKKTGKSLHQVQDLILDMREAGEIPADAFLSKRLMQVQSQPDATKDRPFRMSIDLQEVQKDYDDTGKIDEGLKNLGTHLIRENDFRLELGIQMDRWRVASQHPKFTNCKRELKGKKFRGVYWAQASVLRQLAKKIDLL